MSSTYSTTLRIQLIDTNTEFEAWGQPTDNNLGTIIEQAITGVEAVSLTNLTTYSLTTANAAVDQARNAVLLFTGNLNANCNVIAPSVEKIYVISNQTTNNKAITIKTSGGNGVQLSNGTNQLVYCNGTTFFSAVNANNILGNLAISGNVSIAGTKITLGTSVISQNTSNLTFNAPTSNIVSFKLNTGALTVPYGTTAQRPASPANGMGRWNSTLGWYEIWNGIIWQQITGFINIDYLVVAGGGAGGDTRGGGGGGAGGMLTGNTTVSITSSYVITVGSGGAGSAGGQATSGTASSLSSLVSTVGGGYGGGNYYGDRNGASGGSGGGTNNDYAGQLPLGSPGAGTSGQGNTGFISTPSGPQIGGGGGGAGQTGGSYQYNGGYGLTNSLRTGSAVYYAGGGGGGDGNNNEPGTPGVGGAGGGGNGGPAGIDPAYPGYPGTANTGGGGGGSGGTLGTPSAGGNGGSGIVVIRYISTYVRATGGTVTTYSSGGNTYYVHTFTSSGTFATI